MKRLLLNFAALLLIGATSTTLAGPIITGFTGGGGPFTAFYGDTVLPSGDAVGYQFTATTNLSVTDLGILDDPVDGTLDSAHTVGLWRVSDQALLGSVSVDATGTLLNGFLYAALGAPIALTGGQDYVLAALYAVDDNDGYLSGPSTVTLDNVSNLVSVFPASSNLGLVFPASSSAGNLGRIGPNLIADAAVPEPTSLALLSLGLVSGLLMRRRAGKPHF